MSLLSGTDCLSVGFGGPREPRFPRGRIVQRTQDQPFGVLVAAPRPCPWVEQGLWGMDAAIYVCVLISLSVENHEVTPMPPILIQYCGICHLLVNSLL